MYQDPWSGMGMDTASMHATYLADAIIDNFKGTVQASALATYHQRRNKHALESYQAIVDLGKDFRQLAP
jgi:flavin-dependent dehydrogenase